MANFPGMGASDAPLPGSDPVLPNDLAPEYAAAQAQAASTAVQRNALFTERIQSRMQQLVDNVVDQVASQVATSVQDTSPQQTVHRGTRGIPVVQPMPSGPSSPLTEAGAPGQAQPPQTVRQSFAEGRDFASANTMGGLARGAMQGAAKYFSEGDANRWQPEQQEDGTIDYVQTDTQGNVIQRAAAGSSLARTAARSTFVRSMAGRIATGAGLGDMTGLLGGAVTKVAGPIGLAYGVTTTAGHLVEKQYEAAVPYRQAFGTDAGGAFAASQRAQDWAAGLRGFGTIGGDRARAQFEQATALGLRDDSRNQAFDFATDMYKKFGIDTQQSMEMVRQAIETGVPSLTSYADTLGEVSKAAVAAGKSSKAAIEDFNAAQKEVATNIVPGQASVNLTSQLAAINNQLPQSLSTELGGTPGVAAMVTPQNVMSSAAMSGQNPLAAMGRLYNPATAGMQGAQSVNATTGQLMTTLAGFSVPPRSPDQMSAAMRDKAGGKMPSPDGQYSIIKGLVGGTDAQAGSAIYACQMQAQSMGIPVPQGGIVQLLWSIAMKDFDRTQETKDARGRGANTYGSGDYKAGDDNTSALKDRLGLSSAVSGDTVMTGVKQTLGLNNMPWSDRNSLQDQMDKVNTGDPGAYHSYLDYLNKHGGTGYTAIEDVLKPGNMSKVTEAGGVNDLNDVKFRVIGDDGKAHDVSLSTVINRGRMGYLSRGQGGIVNQDHPNEAPTSLQELFNLPRQGDKTSGSSTSDQIKNLLTKGQGQSGSGSIGSLNIYPKGGLDKFIKAQFSPSPSQLIGEAAPSFLNPFDIPNFGG